MVAEELGNKCKELNCYNCPYKENECKAFKEKMKKISQGALRLLDEAFKGQSRS